MTGHVLRIRKSRLSQSDVSGIETAGNVLSTIDRGAVRSQHDSPRDLSLTRRGTFAGAVQTAAEFREGQNRSNIGC